VERVAFWFVSIKRSRVLRRISRPKRDGVTGDWRKLHNEEFHNLYSSLDIIRQMKSRRMRWAGHVACMGEERKLYRVLVGKPKGNNHSEDQGVGGRMGSEWILGDWLGGVWVGFDWLRIVTGGELL
jgi:hypothetical protein